jgi:hypothetical protein
MEGGGVTRKSGEGLAERISVSSGAKKTSMSEIGGNTQFVYTVYRYNKMAVI